MNQSFADFQPTILPLEYVEYITQKRSKERFYRPDDSYWERLPSYVIARCPICQAEYSGRLDLHSLGAGWSTSHAASGKSFFSEEHQHFGCDHFLAVQRFVNLNGMIPSELSGYTAQLHVPFVMPYFLKPTQNSFAIICRFILCRLEREDGSIYCFYTHAFESPVTTKEAMKAAARRETRSIKQRSDEDTQALGNATYVPRYAAYAVTYFSEHPRRMWQNRLRSERRRGEGDSEYRGMMMATMESMRGTNAYDLPYWVEQGKLLWLNHTDMTLQSVPVEDFPYRDIRDDSGTLGAMYF